MYLYFCMHTLRFQAASTEPFTPSPAWKENKCRRIGSYPSLSWELAAQQQPQCILPVLQLLLQSGECLHPEASGTQQMLSHLFSWIILSWKKYRKSISLFDFWFWIPRNRLQSFRIESFDCRSPLGFQSWLVTPWWSRPGGHHNLIVIFIFSVNFYGCWMNETCKMKICVLKSS